MNLFKMKKKKRRGASLSKNRNTCQRYRSQKYKTTNTLTSREGLVWIQELWSYGSQGQPFKKYLFGVSLVAQMVKSLPAMRETWVQSPDWEDPLEKEMATHSSTLAWKIPWTEELGRLQSMGSQRVGHEWVTSVFSLSCWQLFAVIEC